MAAHPTLAPRADLLVERQRNPIASFLSSVVSGLTAGNGNTTPTSSSTTSTSTSTSTSTTPTTTSSSTSSSSRITTQSSSIVTPTSTSTSSTSFFTPTTSSTTTSTTSTTSSTSSSVFTTSSPTTLVTTSDVVSGTSTSRVVITTVVTPVVTATASPGRASSSSSSSDNSALIGGVVGGVVGGLALIALIIAICITANRRKSRTGHAYFLCFGERPSRAAKGELGHSGGAWPTFDPKDEYGGPGYGSAAAAAGAGAGAGAYGAAAIGSRRRRRDQTQATLPEHFANEEDPESYGQPTSSAAHNAYAGYDGYEGYDPYQAYNNGGATGGYPEMHEHRNTAAGALAASAAAGGAGAYYANNHNRRSSAGHPSYGGAGDPYSAANLAANGTTSAENAPAPWSLPMMGWNDTHGPYSVAGVGHVPASPPQAQFMVSPSEANNAAGVGQQTSHPQATGGGPDYSHFDPPEVRDARAREAAAAALTRGSFSTNNSHPTSLTPAGPTSPRRQSQLLSSPRHENVGLVTGTAAAPPAYVDAQEGFEEVASEPRRLHLTNAEPDMTDEDSSRGGPSRRPPHNHKDTPPSATYRPY